jgi:hypothetical protein
MRRLAAAATLAALIAPISAGAAPQMGNLATRNFSLHCDVIKGDIVARNVRGVFIAKGTQVTITVRAARAGSSRLRIAAAFDSLFDREELGRTRAPLGATSCVATAKGRSLLKN